MKMLERKGCRIVLILLGSLIPNVIAYVENPTTQPEIVIGALCTKNEGDDEYGELCFEHGNFNQSDTIAAEFTNFEKTHIFTFKYSIRYVIFECTAPYPVNWVYTHDNLVSRTGNILEKIDHDLIYYGRQASNISDLSTFIYTASWSMDNPPVYTGEYVCQPMKETPTVNTTSKMIIFEETNVTQNPFLLSAQNVTVWITERNDGSVLLPCFVNNPSVNVSLLKMFAPDKWDPVHATDEVTFFPELGFIFNSATTAKLLSPGSYKCVADSFTILITLKSGDKPQPPDPATQMIIAPAKLSIEANLMSEETVIRCCSSSAIPPVLKLQRCFGPIHCEKELRYNPNMDLPQDLITTNESDNCQTSIVVDSVITGEIPLNIFCKGDGVDFHKILLPKFAYNANTICYHGGILPVQSFYDINSDKWEVVDSTQLIWISVPEVQVNADVRDKLILYDNTTVIIVCQAPDWYYTQGAHFSLIYENGTSVTIIETTRFPDPIEVKIEVNVTKEIKSFTCLVPELLSEKWINKTVEVQVEDASPPEIFGSDEIEEVTWNAGAANKNLQVQVSENSVSLVWKKDNDTIFDTYELFEACWDKSIFRNTTFLTFDLVTPEDAGEYECEAENYFGKAVKKFRVSVQSSS